MIYGIIQARMGSNRLPGKVLIDICGKPGIKHVYDRLSKSERIDKIVLATSVNHEDDELHNYCQFSNIPVFRGSEKDVLDRFYKAALELNAGYNDYLVRITGDCPLIDAEVCDAVIDLAVNSNADYISNTLIESFPDGLDCEVISFEALENAWQNAKLNYEREHVTQYIIRHEEMFRLLNYENDTDLGYERWTLDEPADLELIIEIYKGLGKEFFSYKEVVDFLNKRPELRKINNMIGRNEGLKKI